MSLARRSRQPAGGLAAGQRGDERLHGAGRPNSTSTASFGGHGSCWWSHIFPPPLSLPPPPRPTCGSAPLCGGEAEPCLFSCRLVHSSPEEGRKHACESFKIRAWVESGPRAVNDTKHRTVPSPFSLLVNSFPCFRLQSSTLCAGVHGVCKWFSPVHKGCVF